MTPSRQWRWAAILGSIVAFSTAGGAAIAQEQVPVEGPVAPPVGAQVAGPVGCPGCDIFYRPPPPPPPQCIGNNCVPPPPPHLCNNGGYPCSLTPPVHLPLSAPQLTATGVPLDQGDDDDPLTQAIHKQWLLYLQSIQQAHQDKHWVNPPYDDWLERHSEDRGVIPPATPDKQIAPTDNTPSSDTSNSSAGTADSGDNTSHWGLVTLGAVIAGLVVAFIWRRNSIKR